MRERYKWTYEHGGFGVERCLTVCNSRGMQVAQVDPFIAGIPVTAKRINAAIRRTVKRLVAEHEEAKNGQLIISAKG